VAFFIFLRLAERWNIYFCRMILSLFIESGLFFLLGLFFFWKKKPLIGWLFVLIGFLGLVLAASVVYIYPDKI